MTKKLPDGYKEINGDVERTWVSLDGDEGYWIEKKINSMTDKYKIPIYCPYCERIMRYDIDTISYRKFNCCSKCRIHFIEGQRDRWESGWRPSKEDVDKIKKK